MSSVLPEVHAEADATAEGQALLVDDALRLVERLVEPSDLGVPDQALEDEVEVGPGQVVAELEHAHVGHGQGLGVVAGEAVVVGEDHLEVLEQGPERAHVEIAEGHGRIGLLGTKVLEEASPAAELDTDRSEEVVDRTPKPNLELESAELLHLVAVTLREPVRSRHPVATDDEADSDLEALVHRLVPQDADVATPGLRDLAHGLAAAVHVVVAVVLFPLEEDLRDLGALRRVGHDLRLSGAREGEEYERNDAELTEHGYLPICLWICELTTWSSHFKPGFNAGNATGNKSAKNKLISSRIFLIEKL